MPKKYRVPGKNSKWYLPRYEYMTVVNFCLQYPELKAKMYNISGLRGVNYDGMPHGSGVGDPTARQAEIIAEADRKIRIIESNVNRASGELSPWMLKAVTDDRATYDRLRYQEGMPLTRNAFGVLRRQIYYLISKEI